MTEFTRYTHYALSDHGWTLYTADGEALDLDAHDVAQLERRGCMPATQSPDVGRLLHPASYVYDFPGSPRFWRADVLTPGMTAAWIDDDSGMEVYADGHRHFDTFAHQRAWESEEQS